MKPTYAQLERWLLLREDECKQLAKTIRVRDRRIRELEAQLAKQAGVSEANEGVRASGGTL